MMVQNTREAQAFLMTQMHNALELQAFIMHAWQVAAADGFAIMSAPVITGTMV
jgi:hypothetical protein